MQNANPTIGPIFITSKEIGIPLLLHSCRIFFVNYIQTKKTTTTKIGTNQFDYKELIAYCIL